MSRHIMTAVRYKAALFYSSICKERWSDGQHTVILNFIQNIVLCITKCPGFYKRQKLQKRFANYIVIHWEWV